MTFTDPAKSEMPISTFKSPKADDENAPVVKVLNPLTKNQPVHE
jgi:hypothetical protein